MRTPGVSRRVVWSPKARQDLRQIWRYFARVASPDIADKLLREIRDATERLAARENYIKELRDHFLDVVLVENPNPIGMVRRTITPSDVGPCAMYPDACTPLNLL